MAPVVLRPLAFGEILDQAFGLFRRNFGQLFVISVVCSGIPSLISIYIRLKGQTDTSVLLSLVVMVLGVVGGAVASGASTFVVSEQYLGRQIDAPEALSRAWLRVGAIISTTLIVGFLAGLGLILFIVPGVIAFVGFSMAVTAVTVEGLDSVDGRARSWELTKGFRWKILGLLMVYFSVFVIGMVALGALGAIMGGVMKENPEATVQAVTIAAAFGSLVTLAINPMLYCIQVVTYYDLRVRKEAFDLDLLATTLEHASAPR